jgi:hypothetical protein
MIRWKKAPALIADGAQKMIDTPLILSASRRTDIPAFFLPWLKTQFQQGFASIPNPFNHKLISFSLKKVRCIVFWSKYPEPLLQEKTFFENGDRTFYLHFTLNDYCQEGFEPNLPPLRHRIALFKKISDLIGPHRLIWRFDPLILLSRMELPHLLEKIDKLAAQIHGCTEKLVFSFADIKEYLKVARRFQKAGIQWEEWTKQSMEKAALGIRRIASAYGIQAKVCGEKNDFSHLGIFPNRCIDDELIRRLCPNDPLLETFLGENSPEQYKKLQDPNQRPACGCILSKDIGIYNSCRFHCLYCYAGNWPHSPVNDNPFLTNLAFENNILASQER